LEKNSKI